jgi:hypothetical protein
MAKHRGSCQCGDVRFEVDADPLFAGHCHCRDCQKASGAGHATSAAFVADALRVQGATAKYESLADSGSAVIREFCARCGGRLFSRRPSRPGLVLVAVAALDDPGAIRPGAHIYQKSRLPWDLVDPALPGFPEMPPGA